MHASRTPHVASPIVPITAIPRLRLEKLEIVTGQVAGVAVGLLAQSPILFGRWRAWRRRRLLIAHSLMCAHRFGRRNSAAPPNCG